MKRIFAALAVLALTLGASTAQATTIGTIGGATCPDCDGLVFTLYSDPSATDMNGDGNTDDFLYTLTLDTSGYTGSDSDWISWVSPNVAQHDDVSQTVAPDGSWAFHDGAANNSNGCNDTLASGKFCSQTATKDTVLDGTLYTWSWIVDVENTADPFILPAHLQAAWFTTDKKGAKKAGAISQGFETGGGTDTGATDTGATDTGATDTGATDTGATDTGSEVPEPASLLLLGSGLAGAAMKLRRNRK